MRWEMYYPSRKTIWYVALLLTTRLISGLAHATLHDFPVAQISVLTVMQLVVVCSSAFFYRLFRSKFTYCLVMVEYVLRLALFVALWTEVLIAPMQ